jgi:hypothetical protein
VTPPEVAKYQHHMLAKEGLGPVLGNSRGTVLLRNGRQDLQLFEQQCLNGDGEMPQESLLKKSIRPAQKLVNAVDGGPNETEEQKAPSPRSQRVGVQVTKLEQRAAIIE